MAEIEEPKSLLVKVKDKNEKAGLNVQKPKIIVSGPITSWQKVGKKNGNSDSFFFFFFLNWDPKSLWMVVAAMKLKDACSLEKKL